jgi:hypothetical protein
MFTSRFECAATIDHDMVPEVRTPVQYASQRAEDTRRHLVSVRPSVSIPAEVPFVACDADGQGGFVSGPKRRPNLPPMADWATRYLAYYGSTALTVLAPKGWYCVGLYGSNGDTLIVTPEERKPSEFLSDKAVAMDGPAITVSRSYASTSGRFHVARVVARLFPDTMKDYVQQVIDEGIEPAGDFPFGAYSGDKLARRNPSEADFETPANNDGMGTQSLMIKGADPISGTVLLLKDGIIQLNARAADYERPLLPVIADGIRWEFSEQLLGDGEMQ